jgi:SAM-dependent methyltransferase
MDSVYDGFAKYYRELIIASGHLKKEKETIDFIMTELGITHDSVILDAACGTGDILKHLFDNGYHRLNGIDGSFGMIERAKDLLPGINFRQIRWQDLSIIDANQEKRDSYDLIFAISISLPHAKNDEIATIFKDFFLRLSVNGILVFDNRKWTTKDNGCLYEDNRPVGVYLNLKKVIVDDATYIIEDKCEYDKDRQFVTYKVSNTNNVINHFNVSYAMIPTERYKDILLSIGFRKVESKIIHFWPYELIYAYK